MFPPEEEEEEEGAPSPCMHKAEKKTRTHILSFFVFVFARKHNAWCVRARMYQRNEGTQRRYGQLRVAYPILFIVTVRRYLSPLREFIVGLQSGRMMTTVAAACSCSRAWHRKTFVAAAVSLPPHLP